MFDLHDIERITAWKLFRDHVETTPTPLEDTAVLWSNAPYVCDRLSDDPAKWPDPWKLILDGKFDNLGIVLGMLYTLQLTQRFKNKQFEIRMYQREKNREFVLVIDDSVLNWDPRTVIYLADLPKNLDFTTIWASS